MAFKMKKTLEFGQKTAFKMRTYSPARQKVDPDAPGTPGTPGYEPPVKREELDEKGKKIYDAHRHNATKEWLMETKGFNQEDADRMIKDGAYSYKDMLKEKNTLKDPKAKKDVAAEPKGKGSEGKPEQGDFEPAYEGGDYSQEDIDKMTEKEKMQKIDGYDPKLDKKKSTKKKKDTNSPLEQEGPIPKKNIPLQPGEMEGTYLYGHNYGDEKIEGAGEGFEPTGNREEQFNARERIIDMEDRASFLIENDIPDLEGSTDPKDVKKLKTLKQTAKNLQHEADIMRERMKNEKKASSNKMKSPAKQTKSGKGNIFTKKGRNQRLVNKHSRVSKDENKSKKSDRLEKKLNKKGIVRGADISANQELLSGNQYKDDGYYMLTDSEYMGKDYGPNSLSYDPMQDKKVYEEISPAKQGLRKKPEPRPRKKPIKGIKKIVDKKAEKVAKIIKKKVSPKELEPISNPGITKKIGRLGYLVPEPQTYVIPPTPKTPEIPQTKRKKKRRL